MKNLNIAPEEGDPDAALFWADGGELGPLLKYLRDGWPVTPEMARYLADRIDPDVKRKAGRPAPAYEKLRDADIFMEYESMGGTAEKRRELLAEEYGVSAEYIRRHVIPKQRRIANGTDYIEGHESGE